MGASIHVIVEIYKDDKWEHVPEYPIQWQRVMGYMGYAILGDVRNAWNIKPFQIKGLPNDMSGKKFRFESEREWNYKRWSEDKILRVRLADGTFGSEFNESMWKEVSKEDYDGYKGRGGKRAQGDRYWIPDPSLIDGEWVEMRRNEAYPTFEQYMSDYLNEELDEIANDYGRWQVDFEEGGYHTPNHLTLKELHEFDYADYTSIKCKVPNSFITKFMELNGVMPDGMRIEEDWEPQVLSDVIRNASFEYREKIVSWGGSKEIPDDTADPYFLGIREIEAIAEKYGVSDEHVRVIFAFDN